MNKDFNYQVARKIAAPLFKKRFNLTIVNEENIPIDEPIILCGNHLHVWDQFPVICSTKRTTHWMAKKEYFDSKMGFLFKQTGAICVDRFGNPKAAENEAIEYLNQGSAIGLFPEGTRNGLKQEKKEELYKTVSSSSLSYDEFCDILGKDTKLSQIDYLEKLYKEGILSLNDYKEAILNSKEYLLSLKQKAIITSDDYDDSLLLPFKFGAVSMAKKTNSTVVPFAITGNYIKNSDNLIVNFGVPFKVDNDLDSANIKLRNNVLKLIKKNNFKK